MIECRASAAAGKRGGKLRRRNAVRAATVAALSAIALLGACSKTSDEGDALRNIRTPAATPAVRSPDRAAAIDRAVATDERVRAAVAAGETPPPKFSLKASPTPEPSPPPTDFLGKARAARADLADFYLRTFRALIGSGYYEKEVAIAGVNQFAHRLWVPDDDETRGKALKTLEAGLALAEIELRDAEGNPRAMHAAYFPDSIQIHRDQYAMILSETGVRTLGPAKLEQFVLAACADFGANALSARPDIPWTLTLLAANLRPGREWTNAKGEKLTMRGLIDEAKAATAPAGAMSCYEFHIAYALSAAAASGHRAAAAPARERVAAALARAEPLFQGDAETDASIEAVLGRVKFGGHALEAFFRADETTLPFAPFRDLLETILDGLARDARTLRDLKYYNGSPEIMVAAPHAIHGLDLAIARVEERRRERTNRAEALAKVAAPGEVRAARSPDPASPEAEP